jgi:hypothetical protein
VTLTLVVSLQTQLQKGADALALAGAAELDRIAYTRTGLGYADRPGGPARRLS